MGTRRAWTAERRARQAEIIRATRPWLHSTGPKTEAGKAASSQNARSSPERVALRQLLNHSRGVVLSLAQLRNLSSMRQFGRKR